MSEITLTPNTQRHRLSPSGIVLQGAAVPMRMGNSQILNSGGTSGEIIATDREVSSIMDATPTPADLRVVVQSTSSAAKYLVEACVPIVRSSELVNSGGNVRMKVRATSTGGVLNTIAEDARYFNDVDATGGLPLEEQAMMHIGQEIELNETTMPGYVEGDTVTFYLEIAAAADLVTNSQVFVANAAAQGPGSQCTLKVTEIG